MISKNLTLSFLLWNALVQGSVDTMYIIIHYDVCMWWSCLGVLIMLRNVGFQPATGV